jgi:hypothetical protein
VKNIYFKAIIKKPIINGEIVKVIRATSKLNKVRRIVWNAY